MNAIKTPGFKVELSLDSDKFFIQDARISGKVELILEAASEEEIKGLRAHMKFYLVGEIFWRYRIKKEEQSMSEIFIREELGFLQNKKLGKDRTWEFAIDFNKRRGELSQSCDYKHTSPTIDIEARVSYKIKCEAQVIGNSNWSKTQESQEKQFLFVYKEFSLEDPESRTQQRTENQEIDYTFASNMSENNENFAFSFKCVMNRYALFKVTMVKVATIRIEDERFKTMFPNGHENKQDLYAIDSTNFSLGSTKSCLRSKNNNLFELSFRVLAKLEFGENPGRLQRWFFKRTEYIDLTKKLATIFLTNPKIKNEKKPVELKLPWERSSKKIFKNGLLV